jgi:SAM-dependent methyltransferase
VGHADLLDAVWAAVPEGAEPERFGVRRDWLLERVAPGATVLDYGCGEGAFAEALAGHGAHPVAVDASPRALRRARARRPDLDWRLVALDAPLPLDEDSVDVAWLGETLEHLVDPVGELHEVRRVLRAGGRLLATTPDHPPALVRRLADDPAAFAAHFSPRTDHLRFFNAASLGELLADLGFQDVAVESDGETLFASAIW